MNGRRHRFGWRIVPAGGTSVRGSIPDRYRANPRTDHHPVGRHDTADRHLTLQRPRERRLDSHELDVVIVEIGHEPWQQPVRVSELVTERAAKLEVLVEVLLKDGHRAAPGHGRATCRKRPRSTFA